jgi:hypothetical protein
MGPGLSKVDVGKVALIEAQAHEKIFQTSGQNCEIIIKIINISCKSHCKMLKLIKFGGLSAEILQLNKPNCQEIIFETGHDLTA